MRYSKATNLMTLHVHKAATDMLKSSDIVSNFVGDSDHRLKMFGTSYNIIFIAHACILSGQNYVFSGTIIVF